MLALSRYREYAADRPAALLTGAPEELMSALQKIAAQMPLIPKRELRQFAGLSAFFIVPTHRFRSRWELGTDHPPLRKRLAPLEALRRATGKALP
jgi:heat shock protein HtpX